MQLLRPLHAAALLLALVATTPVSAQTPDDGDVAMKLLREQYPANYDGSNIHIVFSNGCGQKNRLLFATAMQQSATRVGQKGAITQIISGCSEDEKTKILAEPRFYYDYRVHFTPDFATQKLPDREDWYMAYNKAFGLRHYLQNANPPVQHELMALTDGDIMLLKPLEANTGRNVTKYYHGSRDPHTVTDEVRDGVALAQDWVKIIGSSFWGEQFGKGKLTDMCAGKPCGSVSEADALEYYSATGPPYIMTTRDMRKFVDEYCHFVVESRKVSTEWMSEMFGYGVAAANLGIKHTILTHLAPTHPWLNGNEYWSFLDDDSLKTNPCADPYAIALPTDPPAGLHYFHYYMLGSEGREFHKGDMPNEILNCDYQMFEVPPASEYEEVFTRYKDNPTFMAQKRAEVWLECTLIKAMNEALIALKTATCSATGFNSFQGYVMMFKRNDK